MYQIAGILGSIRLANDWALTEALVVINDLSAVALVPGAQEDLQTIRAEILREMGRRVAGEIVRAAM